MDVVILVVIVFNKILNFIVACTSGTATKKKREISSFHWEVEGKFVQH